MGRPWWTLSGFYQQGSRSRPIQGGRPHYGRSHLAATLGFPLLHSSVFFDPQNRCAHFELGGHSPPLVGRHKNPSLFPPRGFYYCLSCAGELSTLSPLLWPDNTTLTPMSISGFSRNEATHYSTPRRRKHPADRAYYGGLMPHTRRP